MSTLEIIMVAFSMIGSLLNARKIKWGMACWIIADILGIPFFIVLQKYYMVGLYIFWTCTSIYGFWYWRMQENEQN